MKKEYDPSKLKSRVNPYADVLLKQEIGLVQEGMNAPISECETKLDWDDDL